MTEASDEGQAAPVDGGAAPADDHGEAHAPGDADVQTAGGYVCPDCGEALAPVEGVAALLRCPTCGREFFVPPADVPPPDADDEIEPPPDEELSALRIRNLAAARRATYRARSYCLIAAAACGVCVVQLAWMIYHQARQRGWGLQCTGYALFAGLGLYGLGYFLLRARELHREAKQSALANPVAPPDFSALDDGSKQWKNLEDVR